MTYYTSVIEENLKWENTKIAKRILDVFDRDVVDIIVYHNSYWFETRGFFPEYARKWIKSYMKKHGYYYYTEV